MDLEYRTLSTEDSAEVEKLWDYCFEKKDDPFFQYYFSDYCFQKNTVIGGLEHVTGASRLRTMLHLNPYCVTLRGLAQRVPYIVGVATAPEARGQHLFAPLLRHTFAKLRAEGTTFVLLMPIFAGIYLPYQFAYCYYRHEYNLPLEKLTLPKQGTELTVEHIGAESLQSKLHVLANLYAALTAPYHGVAVRGEEDWRKLLTVQQSEQVQCALVYREDAAVGYMLYRIADDCFTIVELLAASSAAQSRLLHYASLHQSSATQLHWLAQPDDLTHLHFADQQVAGRLAPFMMARCIDAVTALEQLDVQDIALTGELVLQLTDNVIEANNHVLSLHVENGAVQVVSTQCEPDLCMDMGTFTQLYFGTFSAKDLWRAGKIACGEQAEEKLELLGALLPCCENYINEYF